eukprot:7187688-Alexandrium_andersonii.AAC.1
MFRPRWGAHKAPVWVFVRFQARAADGRCLVLFRLRCGGDKAPAKVSEGVRGTGDDMNGRPRFPSTYITLRALPSSGHLPGSLREGGAVW